MNLCGNEVILRLMEPSDENFVMSTWLRSARDVTRMGKDKFFSLSRPQVEADVKNGLVLIACDEAAPGTIYGWVCFRDHVVRWAYTVFQLRNNGISTFIRSGYESATAEAADA